LQARVLIVGCGDVGALVASTLSQADCEVFTMSRSEKVLEGVQCLQADVTKPETLSTIATLNPEYVIYCIAAGKRTDEAYKAQYVDGLRNVLATQADNQVLKGVVFVSSTRVYGQQIEEVIDHTVKAIPNDFGGRRLLEAEQLLDNLNCHTIALRLSGIYGPGRLRMIRLAQSDQWPENNAWSNRIHRDDAVRFIVHVIEKWQKGIVFATTRQYTVLTWIAQQVDGAVPAHQAPLVGGKRLSNQAMLQTGFRLNYPDFKEGYAALFQQL